MDRVIFATRPRARKAELIRWGALLLVTAVFAYFLLSHT